MAFEKKIKDDDLEKYEVETVTDGTFHDQGYEIRTIVFRVSPDALDDYNWKCKKGKEDPDWYDTEEEFREALQIHDDNLRAWEKRMKDMLGWKKSSGSITQDVSEIFTAVFMRKEK